uniref:Uncharacterized protein n=1 Tax=Opuntia streptacantha TaxID=393608 RepID=A0A7C8YWE9_OPUST
MPSIAFLDQASNGNRPLASRGHTFIHLMGMPPRSTVVDNSRSFGGADMEKDIVEFLVTGGNFQVTMPLPILTWPCSCLFFSPHCPRITTSIFSKPSPNHEIFCQNILLSRI